MNDRGGLTTDPGSITSNTWYHVVITSTPGSSKIYLNGSLKQTNNSTSTILYWDQPVWIGKGNWNTTREIDIRHVKFSIKFCRMEKQTLLD